MLAQLDKEIAPLLFSVDREGAWLRAKGGVLPVDLAVRVLAIVEELGFMAEELAGSAPAISRWFGATAVDELSQEEATVLAERWIEELEAGNVVPQPQRLIESLSAALLDAFRAAARTGKVGAPHVDEFVLVGVLDASEAEQVRQWLDHKLRGLNLDGE